MTPAMTPAEARAMLETAGSDAVGWRLAERPAQPDVVVLVAPPTHLVLLRGAGLTDGQLVLMAAAPDLARAYLAAVERVAALEAENVGLLGRISALHAALGRGEP